jgi:hypothetical protein
MSGNTHDFNNIETRAVSKFLPLSSSSPHPQGKAPKEIHAILRALAHTPAKPEPGPTPAPDAM